MIFLSTMVYALGKELGLAGAVAEFHRQCGEPSSESLPAVRVAVRLAQLEPECGLYIDPAATCIGKGRSRAFHAARMSGADVWVSVDDDVDADTETLRMLLEAVSDKETPRVVFAPYWLREQERVAAALGPAPLVRPLKGGGECLTADGGGFGLVAVNRKAMGLLALEPDLTFMDDDGVTRVALFHDLFAPPVYSASRLVVTEGRWYGEDSSFYKRARAAGVRIEALASGHTVHCGRMLKLEQIGSLPRYELA